MDLAAYKARRPRQEQANLLVLAFVCSLLAHVIFALAWEFRAHLPQLAWLEWMKKQSAKLDPAALLLKLDQPKPLPPELQKLAALRPPAADLPMPQLTFVDVDPAQASEPPKDAKFYSATSTRAANPEAKIESNVPKLDGKQTQMVKVQDVPKPLPPAAAPPTPQPKAPPPPPKTETTPEPKPQPAPTPPAPAPKAVASPPPQPATPTPPTAVATPPKPAPAPPAPPEPQPKKVEPQPLQPAPTPAQQIAGETLRPTPKPTPPAPPTPTPSPTPDPVVVQVAKAVPLAPAPSTTPAPNPSTTSPTKPAEPGDTDTKISRPRTIKEAIARRQESGLVGEKMQQDGGVKRLGVSALDVRGMSFGAYDQAIVHAIQQRWFDLLETRFAPRGKVVIEFRLHHDGRVTGLKVGDSDVGDLYVLLCQKAVQDPAPFPRWPSDMRRQLQADHRDIRFTFFYH